MKLLKWASQGAFSLVRFLDDWVGLPEKVAASLHYRRSWRKYLSVTSVPAAPVLWVHGASVGELEDVMAFVSRQDLLQEAGFTYERLIVTASSVSARSRLEQFRESHRPLYAGPLPPESPAEVKDFLKILRPEYLLLSHSDLWPVLLGLAQKTLKRIIWLPAHEASARFTAPLLLPVAKTHLGQRRSEKWQGHQEFPQSFVGNLRVDRILSRIEKQRKVPEHILERLGAQPQPQKISFLLGSAWLEDGHFWAEALKPLSPAERASLQLVVMPHEIHDSFQTAQLQGLLPEARILGVEGILVEAYQNFSAAFVGGGFRTGLHNVLEPALWARPTYCGPLLRKQADAPSLVRGGQLQSFSDPAAFALELKKWIHEPAYRSQRQAEAQRGAQELLGARGASERLASLVGRQRQL